MKNEIIKEYGPYIIDMPSNFKNDTDQTKFLMNELIDHKMELPSFYYITKIGADVVQYEQQDIIDHKMGNIKLDSYIVNYHNDKQKIKQYDKDSCIINYIWNEIKYKKGFLKYTYEKSKMKYINM